MNAYCPECETELDVTTGICPACRWNPLVARATDTREAPDREVSLTERYRGTQFDLSNQQMALDEHSGVSRGRVFVLVGLIAGVTLYGGVISAMGLF